MSYDKDMEIFRRRFRTPFPFFQLRVDFSLLWTSILGKFSYLERFFSSRLKETACFFLTLVFDLSSLSLVMIFFLLSCLEA